MNYTAIIEEYSFLDLGSVVITLPSQEIDDESKSLFEITRDPEIVKWLSKLGHIRCLTDARDFIVNKLLLVAVHQNLFLTLKFKDSGRTFGYIMLDAPNKSNGNTWLLEFFIEPELRRNGIMYAAIHRVLSYLQSKGVTFVTALTGPDNFSSISLLKKLNFKKFNEKSSIDYNCYLIRLN